MSVKDYKESCDLMYGLVGKTLKHSLSKMIHEALRPMDYHLFETNDIQRFLTTTPFKAINVTIPYKQAVIPYCDYLSDLVKRTNSVNTIIKKNGLLFAYNTDFEALDQIAKYFLPQDKNLVIGIIGNGATARSMKEALIKNNYKNITLFARNPNKNESPITSLQNYSNLELLINTTPVGMYPNNEQSFNLDLTKLKTLSCVYDVVYNPYKTKLLLDAEALNIKTLDGLLMLVIQAVLSNGKFFNTTYSKDTYETLYKKALKYLLNITFIGLPFSGKTRYSKELEYRLNKPIIDIDSLIEHQEKKSIETIFNQMGEPYFRALEEQITVSQATSFNHILSTGGGIIQNDRAMQAIKQNSVVVYIDIDEAIMDQINYHSRPHVKNKTDLLALKNHRHKLYLKYADVIINKSTLDVDKILSEIEVNIDAYISDQWAKLKSIRN